MCIAIYKPEGKVIPYETLKRCFTANPDGAGYMFHKNGKLHVFKGYFTMDEFWKAYKRDQKKECVIHFRIKTHGLINEENCHPYRVNDDLAFVHNGVISGYSDVHKSDTWLFNEDIVQPFVRRWGNLEIFEDPIKKLIENRIGYSKLIFMDNLGNTKIFNEDKGNWDDGVWYSNTSYKPYIPPPPVVKPVYGSYYSGVSSYPKPVSAISEIKEGDYVYLTQMHEDYDTHEKFERNTIFEVLGVNKDRTVDVVEDLDGPHAKFGYNIPIWKLRHFDFDNDFVSTENSARRLDPDEIDHEYNSVKVGSSLPFDWDY